MKTRTITDLRVAAHRLGFCVRVDDGEYRIAPSASIARRHGTTPEAMAYYTSDRQDAWDTLHEMAGAINRE